MLSSCEAKLVPSHNAGEFGRLQRDVTQSEREKERERGSYNRRWGRRRSIGRAGREGRVLFLSFSYTHSATRGRKCVLYGRKIRRGCVCAFLFYKLTYVWTFFIHLLWDCTSGKKTCPKTTRFIMCQYINANWMRKVKTNWYWEIRKVFKVNISEMYSKVKLKFM